MSFFQVEIRQHRCRWCNYNQTERNDRNNVFRSKQTTNKVPPKIFRGFEVRRKVRLIFWKPKHNMKRKCYVFSCYEQRDKVWLVYLEIKLRDDWYFWSILKLKLQKTVHRTYIETGKHQTTICWCLEVLKSFPKGNNCIFRLYYQTRKVQCMYLAFKTLKITKENVNTGQKVKRIVRMIFFEVPVLLDRCRWSNYNLNWKEKPDVTYLEASKAQPRYRLSLRIKKKGTINVLKTKREHER